MKDPLDKIKDDPSFEHLLREISTRDSWTLFERALSQMQEFAINSLINASSEEERVGVQALVTVTSGLRQRLTRYRRELEERRSIQIGG